MAYINGKKIASIFVTGTGVSLADGGEVFNDTEHNEAVGKHSHAEGCPTLAGSKAFTIINTFHPNIPSSPEYEGLYQLDSVEGLEVGDVFSVHLCSLTGGEQKENYGKIVGIFPEYNVVTVDKHFTINNWTTKSSYLKEGIDSEENTFRIIEKPLVGTRNIGAGSHSEGLGNQALCKGAHTEGGGNNSYGAWSHTEGKKTKAGYCAHAEGEGSEASGFLSHAENSSKATGWAAHSEGSGKALETYTHAEGNQTEARYMMAHAEGYATVAKKTAAHSEGIKTESSGHGSHAEGVGNIASGNGAHAEGGEYNQSTGAIKQKNEASGVGSHAEGLNTIASGDAAHSEGQGTYAISNYAHSEGIGTKATKLCAHAEGHTTLAGDENAAWNVGLVAHAEGYLTKAFGSYSHAEGQNTLASGENSHAGGLGTIASAENQTAIGMYNKENPNALFIVGNGTSNTDRHNAFEVYKDGSIAINEIKITPAQLQGLLALVS